MTGHITLWGRNGHPASLEAIAFLKEHGFGADRLLDLDRQPPQGEEWQELRRALGGSITTLVDTHHPRFTAVLPQSLGGLGEEALEKVLEAHPLVLKAPILLTPKGALVGFRERHWAKFLGLDDVSGD